MEELTQQEIEAGLNATRSNLVNWLHATPTDKQQRQLASSDSSAVQDHLNVVSTSLEQIASGGLGICEVCHDPVDDALLRMDYTACVCLGHYSDQELRALEKELELSQVIQRALLPRHPPAINGIDTAGFSRPASIVGGDYFDFVRFKDGSHGFIVADVSGHGVSAGMLMTSLQTAFQTLAPDTKSPVEVLQRLNRLYLHNINFTTFVTIFFGQYEPSSRLFTYANAGHNSGYLYRSADQHEEWLHATGPAIGLMEGYSVRTEEVQLHPGDHLVLYTDGVTEAVNQDDEPFGEDRLAEAVRKSAGRPAEAMVQAILSAITLFMGTRDFADDATLVVLKAS